MSTETQKITGCPKCKCKTLRVDYVATALVEFDSDPDAEHDHEVIDTPPGDIQFDDESIATCSSCHHTGKLGEFVFDREA